MSMTKFLSAHIQTRFSSHSLLSLGNFVVEGIMGASVKNWMGNKAMKMKLTNMLRGKERKERRDIQS